MEIVERYAAVQDRILRAARRAGRRPEQITLIVVTKTWPPEVVVAAYEAGIRHFGENRAEELAAKRAEVESLIGRDNDITWHGIGALQSRKTNLAADNADVFHALDRLKIANRLSRRLLEIGRGETDPMPTFIEVNVSGEGSKAGIDCSHWEEDERQRENLRELARTVGELPGLEPHGLMTMAPWQVEEAQIRQVFERTRQLSRWLANKESSYQWSKLSMGMTDDFEIAIEEGATHVRIGRAILGDRR